MTSTEEGFNPTRPDAVVTLTPAEEEVFKILLEVAESVPEAQGVTLRVAGGWVRDKLFKLESDDIDITVDKGSGASFAALVAIHVGKEAESVATIKANPDASKHLETATFKVNGIEVDFAALRSETYADSRIPEIRPGTPSEDAHRRDLTLNSLFYNIHTRQVEDWTGRGVDDLMDRAVVTPLEPFATFIDDPLRVLRTVRFAARFNGKLHADIQGAAKNPQVHEALEKKISKERLWVELWKMLKGPNPEYGARLLRDLNLHPVLFPSPPIDTLPQESRVRIVDPGVYSACVVERLVASGVVDGLDKETRARVLLAGLISPLWGSVEATVGKKGKSEYVPSWSVMTGLKAPGKECKLVGAVGRLLPLWGSLLTARRAQRSVSGTGAPLWADCDVTVWNRVSVGAIMRTDAKALGLQWWIVPAIALAAEDLMAAVPDYEAPDGAQAGDDWGVLWRAKSGAMVGDDYQGLVKEVIDVLGLDGVWDLKPALTGSEVAQLLDLKPGPDIAKALDLLMKMQLTTPGASVEELKATLVEGWALASAVVVSRPEATN